MSREDWRRELDEEYALTEDDIGLLEHIFGDDEPPQGLHRRGFDRRERENEEQARLAEERAYDDWRYPDLEDYGDVY